MIKNTLTLALVLAALPLMLLANPVTACGHHHHKTVYKACDRCNNCCNCQKTKNMALVHRVVTHLRANITTADQPICVTANGHKVTLSGRIGTSSQRQVALDITRNTCGVSLVIDNMHLSEP